MQIQTADEAIVTLDSIYDKINLLQCYDSNENNFVIKDHVPKKRKDINSFYSKFCKFALGISKYASNYLSLAELGKYPVSIKSHVLALLYWLRLEHGTENNLLNYAFKVMKEENHVWLQNIFNYLASIGLGHTVSETHLF